MDALTLHTEIAKVCPLTSARVGVEDDRTTWGFTSKEEATDEQKTAGQNVIDTIDVNYKLPPEPSPTGTAVYDHENRLRALEGQPPLSLVEFMTKVKATVI